MKNLRITVNGKSYDVQVEELAEGAVPVSAPAAPAPVQAAPVTAAPAAPAGPEPGHLRQHQLQQQALKLLIHQCRVIF